MTMRKSRNATRRSRNRRGSRRVVRRNKTMKGGIPFIPKISIPGISREECRQTGHAFAIGSLTKGGFNGVPTKDEGTVLKQKYSTYYDTLGGDPSKQNIPVYTPNIAGDSILSKGFSFLKKQGGDLAGAIPGATIVPGSKKSMLRPKDFNNIMDKITSGWIDNFFTKRILKSMNQELVDFGLSYTKMRESTQNPQTNTGSNPATSAADKAKGMLGSFTGSATSKISGLSLFGNKQ